LIVDDNSFNLIPLELLLETHFGIKVDKAENGKIAVDMVERDLRKECCEVRYKLVLMDLNMPVMDGYEATEQIMDQVYEFNQERGKSVAINIVACTAFANEVFIEKCY